MKSVHSIIYVPFEVMGRSLAAYDFISILYFFPTTKKKLFNYTFYGICSIFVIIGLCASLGYLEFFILKIFLFMLAIVSVGDKLRNLSKKHLYKLVFAVSNLTLFYGVFEVITGSEIKSTMSFPILFLCLCLWGYNWEKLIIRYTLIGLVCSLGFILESRLLLLSALIMFTIQIFPILFGGWILKSCQFFLFIVFNWVQPFIPVVTLHESASNLKRIELLSTGIHMFINHLYFPAGFKAWRDELATVTNYQSHLSSNIATHNTFLDIALNFGLFGVLGAYAYFYYLLIICKSKKQLTYVWIAILTVSFYPVEGDTKTFLFFLIVLIGHYATWQNFMFPAQRRSI